MTYGAACTDNNVISLANPDIDVWNACFASCQVTVSAGGGALLLSHNSAAVDCNGTITSSSIPGLSAKKVVLNGSFSAGIQLRAVFAPNVGSWVTLPSQTGVVTLTVPGGGQNLVVEYQTMGANDIISIDTMQIFDCQ